MFHYEAPYRLFPSMGHVHSCKKKSVFLKGFSNSTKYFQSWRKMDFWITVPFVNPHEAWKQALR